MPSLIESVVTLDVGAQEPWPNDVKLYQPYAMEQILLPDNANCLAVQAFLHMCGLPFQIEHRSNAEFMSPSGKVPFIKCGAFVVSELEPIVQFVGNKGITLTEELTADQKSDLRAYMSIIYTVLMNAELYICWCDKRTYNEVTKVRNGSVYPWPLNHLQNWSKKAAVTRKLKVLGWYQKTLESVYQDVENCCQALSERLDGKEYFFGSKPTELDAELYGHIFAIVSSPEYSNELISIIMKFPLLIAHCKRICVNYVLNTSLNVSEIDAINIASKNAIGKSSSIGLDKKVKRTDSLTNCVILEDTHCEESKKTKFYNLSESDHDYLKNLFCADKPAPKTEVKYKSPQFTETSMSNLEIPESKVTVNSRISSVLSGLTISTTAGKMLSEVSTDLTINEDDGISVKEGDSYVTIAESEVNEVDESGKEKIESYVSLSDDEH